MSNDSVVAQVRDLLESKKAELGSIFDATFKSRAKTPAEEIKDLNNYLRIALGRAQVTTMEERSCLRDDLAPGVWLRYFENHVLPTIVRFDLLGN